MADELTEAERAAEKILDEALPHMAGLVNDALAQQIVAAVRPIIAAEVLGLKAETEHIVEFEEDTFSVQHPLSERLDGSLFDCQFHAELSALGGPPVAPGRYRAVASGAYSRYRFEPLADTDQSRTTTSEGSSSATERN
jgi:hypothetical protein